VGREREGPGRFLSNFEGILLSDDDGAYDPIGGKHMVHAACWAHATRHPEVELSNNLAENAMRPVALGRKNWIHLGSKEAGPRVAAIISIVETCRRLNLRVRDYMASVLPGLADFPINRVAELTPTSWAVRH
jgi:hypothetical protein